VRRIEHNKYQLLLDITNENASNNLLLTLTDSFPQTKPICSVQGTLQHPWIDPYRFVTGCKELNSWNESSSLAKVILEIKRQLESGVYISTSRSKPTNMTMSSNNEVNENLIRSNQVPLMINNNYNNSEKMVVTDNVDDTKRESAHSLDQGNHLHTESYAFDGLSNFDTNRLIGLLTNDILFEAFSSTFRPGNTTSRLKNELIGKNIDLAYGNKDRKVQLTKILQEIEGLQCIYDVEIHQYQSKVTHSSNDFSFTVERIITDIESNCQLKDRLTEEHGDCFVEGKSSLHQFLDNFLSKERLQYHLMLIKKELLSVNTHT
jgi:hypothetical protein